MGMKRHHKIIITSFSSIFLIAIIVSIVLLFINQSYQYKTLNNQITHLQADTQSKLNELTENILHTKNSLETITSEIGSMSEEFDELKASAGEDFSGIIEEAIKSVVTIKTDISQGTGFIIDSDGYIVTNYHVIAGAKQAGIFTYEGGTHTTSLIGYNSKYDIALLSIKGNYDELELADSDDIQIGEKVIAIGNPLGLQFSVSEGIVSAIHRPGINEIKAYIQTDAALNPGNSGGPLINKKGKVIGINNFKIGGGESLGFALESNYIKDIVNEISNQVLNQTLI